MSVHAFGIANAHPFFQYALCSPRLKFHGKLSSVSFAFGDEQSVPCDWKHLDKFNNWNFDVGRVEMRRCGRFLVKASATTTLEVKRVAGEEGEVLGSKDLELGLNTHPSKILLESCYEDSEGLDEREKLRRMRISEANKGNTPWNKGRKLSKHSAETLRKIRERTRLAMQSPKVKMKLVNPRKAHTTERKQKIAAGVKMRWQRRREKMVVQETCCLEWQNLIAQASKEGYVDQKELQWNSYETLDEQLKLELLVSVKQRKQMPRAPGSKTTPRTSGQRRKVAEAISVDLEYRRKGCSPKAKYHDTEGAEMKPRRRPSDDAQSTRSNSVMEKDTANDISVESGTRFLNLISSGNAEFPAFKDNLESPKLDMMKSIKAQRAIAETKLNKAIERARLLIAEAEKAAKALEATETKSPFAQASLMESRKLIAEAIQSLQSIDTKGITVSNVPSVALTVANEENDTEFEVLSQSHMLPINGKKTLSSSDYNKFPEDLGKCSSDQQMETEQDESSEYKTDPSPTVLGIQSIKNETQPELPAVVSKKWVRGRLVEEKQN